MTLLQGEWQAVGEADLDAYVFEENNQCISRTGFFTYKNPDREEAPIRIQPCIIWETKKRFLLPETDFGNISKYYGYETQYKLRKDSLLIYNPAKEIWDRYKMSFSSSDSLVLESKDETKLFAKRLYPQDTTALYDQVIFHFTTEVDMRADYWDKRISINKNGEVLYMISKKKSSQFSARGKMDSKHIEYMESLFKQSSLAKKIRESEETTLQISSYPIEPSITFVKDNKIVSFNYPLNYFQSKEFMWAYTMAWYCDDAYITIEKNKLDEIGITHRSFAIENKEYRLPLSESDKFYLFSLLYNANHTSESFTPKYTISTTEFEPEYNSRIHQGSSDFRFLTIETDGRYFRYTLNDKERTLDIGFNFIEINNLAGQFKHKDEFYPKMAVPINE